MHSMNEQNCPVCNIPLTDSGREGDRYQYDCQNCGRYSLSGTAKSMVKSRVAASATYAAVLSHTVRRMQRRNDWPQITSDLIYRIEQQGHLPDAAEQAENLILWLGESQKHPGDKSDIELHTYPARVGAFNGDGVAFILNALHERRLVDANVYADKAVASLSFDGWKLFHQLTHGSSAGARAFMAMPFDNPDLDKLVRDYFRPAVGLAGFDLIRLDEEPRAGSIDERLRVEIRRSKLLIADLTDGNSGAYWEAGFAEGLSKPVIYTCEKGVFEGGGTHFDTNHLQTVVWDSEDPSKAAHDLTATVRATLPEDARMNDPE